MPWSSVANNQAISDTNLKDAVDTGVFTAGGTAFPSPTQNKEVTKSRCSGYITVPDSSYPPFAVKQDNQIIAKGDVPLMGEFVLDPAYNKYFTAMTGTGLPTFTFNVTSPTTKKYNGTIVAQNIAVTLSGNAVTSPVRVSLYLNSVLIQSVAIAQNGSTSATLTLPSDVTAPNQIRIGVDTGSVPSGTFTFGSNPVNCVAVSKSTGQYQIASIGSWDYNASGFFRYAKTGGYICYSSDYGATWNKSNITGTFCKLAIADGGQYCLAASQSGYLYRSTNYGATWSAVTSLGQTVWSGACIATNTTDMYACTRYTYPASEGKVYKSTDYGATWSNVTPASGKDFNAIDVGGAVSPANVIVGLATYTGGNAAYYVSTNSGTSWGLYTV